jgi:hypothetical protein
LEAKEYLRWREYSIEGKVSEEERALCVISVDAKLGELHALADIGEAK